MMQFTRGLTLVEILIVIAIVGLLSAIIAPAYIDAREAARDDARKSDLKRLQLAVENYYAEFNQYPTIASGNYYGLTNGPTLDGTAYVQAPYLSYIVGIVPSLIDSLPRDPVFGAVNGRGYYYRSDGSAYKILAFDSVENRTVESYDDEFARCPYTCGGNSHCAADPHPNTYAVYSRGAECW